MAASHIAEASLGACSKMTGYPKSIPTWCQSNFRDRFETASFDIGNFG
jgi:hypothetical protein